MHIIRSETLGRRLAGAKSLVKSLAESLTKSLAETLSETLGETFSKTLGETFRSRQAAPQSLGSDYMHGSLQDSARLVFLRGKRLKFCYFSVFYHPKIQCFFAIFRKTKFSCKTNNYTEKNTSSNFTELFHESRIQAIREQSVAQFSKLLADHTEWFRNITL